MTIWVSPTVGMLATYLLFIKSSHVRAFCSLECLSFLFQSPGGGVDSDAEENEDIGEMFSVYAKRKAVSQTNLDRMSPFSVSDSSHTAVARLWLVLSACHLTQLARLLAKLSLAAS